MKKESIQPREVKITDDVLCNQCGETLECKESPGDFYGMINAKVSGGFYSTELEDCIEYKFDLCEKCLKIMFKSFKIAVETEEYCI